jgi:hypothetical protein
LQRSHVCAGAITLSCTRHHNDAYARVRNGGIKRSEILVTHARGPRIQTVGAIKRNETNSWLTNFEKTFTHEK